MVTDVHSYQVPNTLLRINYVSCFVSTMVPSGFGPYHGLGIENATTTCIGIIPTQWVMSLALGLVYVLPPQHQ